MIGSIMAKRSPTTPPHPAGAHYIPVLIGCEIVTALGDLDATWNAMVHGQSALRPLPIHGLEEAFPLGTLSSVHDSHGSTERLRTILRQVHRALSLTAPIIEQGDLIVATTKGAADELLGDRQNEWQGQSWQVGGLAARAIGCGGSVSTVSAACASGTLAIIEAAQRIMSGRSRLVTVVGVDICSHFVTAGFASLQALSAMPCRPFDHERDGLSLGEGAGIVVLASKSHASELGLDTLAVITGFGAASDATHITAPDRSGNGLKVVIDQATRNGKLPVGAINAHGTGTIYNDAMELTAFRRAWDDLPPLHSVKGAIGHTLGAAGVIEAAIAVRSLREGFIPPTIGYRSGDVPAEKISGTATLPLSSPAIFSCNSGFGGINAGILLASPGS